MIAARRTATIATQRQQADMRCDENFDTGATGPLGTIATNTSSWAIRMNRRELVTALAMLGCTPGGLLRSAHAAQLDTDTVFAHGVASGDPLSDRVILWTRVNPQRLGDTVEVQWRIGSDERMQRVLQRGRVRTDAMRDFTVKVDAQGLRPGETYHYQFEARGAKSPVGRTRTLPVATVRRMRLAFASCSNYPYGYFNAYARIAERSDLDCVLHLGDYLYEYRLGGYADSALAGQRDVVPTHEMVTLADYRARHALYKSDPDLQEVHRQHPFICVWDDHEITNDTYRDGAENHNPQEGEGEWRERRRAAVRVYNEYMPIRTEPRASDRIFRSFRLGDLADLIMLDTRLHGRDAQAGFKGESREIAADDAIITNPQRSLLGADQEAWLQRQLLTSQQRGAKWRVLGQQVMLAQLSLTAGRTVLNPDQWDGYAPARERLFQHLREQRITDNVVLTGDIHSSWCADLTSNPWDAAYDAASGRGVLGVEFTCPGITSPSSTRDPSLAIERARRFRDVAPHFKYVELLRRGYGVLDLTPERAQAELYHVDTVAKPDASQSLSRVMVSERGDNTLRPG
jgi:alkaline phosphatase D